MVATTDFVDVRPYELHNFYWLHLRSRSTTMGKCCNAPRFLLLHGWLQDHTAWGQLPCQLIELFGGEAIVLDFFGMGKSPDPRAVEDLTPDLLLQQVECCIEMAGWKEEPSCSKIVVAGMSLGGGIALRFAAQNISLINRIVLVAPSALPDTRTLSFIHWGGTDFSRRIGLGEPSKRLSPAEAIFKPILSAAGRTARMLDVGKERGVLHRIACNANLVQHAPNYGCSVDITQKLASHRIPLSHISAGLDYVVQPHLSKYICGRTEGVHLLRWPRMTHEWMCTNIDSLNLHKYPQVWTDVKGSPHFTDFLDDHVLMHDGQWLRPRSNTVRDASRL